MMYMDNSPQLNYQKHHKIDIRYNETFMLDGSPVNQSIVKLTKGASAARWRGPDVIMMNWICNAYDYVYGETTVWGGITAADLSHAVGDFSRVISCTSGLT